MKTRQLDFWPDQSNPVMVALARLSYVAAHRNGCARSGSEDATVAVRVRRASAKQGAPLGIPALNPDSFCTSQKKRGGKDA